VKFPKIIVLCLFMWLTVPVFALADDPDLDPFYTKGVSIDAPPINDIVEEVDPFSGNLKIVQTDLEFPQNGGLELKIMRYYDSAIWKV